jgi:hypothetical protein
MSGFDYDGFNETGSNPIDLIGNTYNNNNMNNSAVPKEELC